MQQFVVPQFIDVEDKIIGPITTRQFLIILAGGLLLFIEYKIARFGIFIIEAIITLMLVAGFSFLKVNGMALHFFVINLLQRFQRPSLRIWRKTVSSTELKKNTDTEPVVSLPASVARVSLSHSRLRELTLVVDTGGAYKADDELVNQKNIITE
ncbi:MAG: hypothetical protein ABIJ81_02105 [Patescibacteria group bacterium]